MRNLLLAGAAAAAIVAFVPAIAQTAPPAPPGVAEGTAPGPRIETRIHRTPMMKAETRNDMVAHAREMFGKLDSNKDGYVTKEEAEAAHHAMADAIHDKFAKRFADGDFPHPDRGVPAFREEPGGGAGFAGCGGGGGCSLVAGVDFSVAMMLPTPGDHEQQLRPHFTDLPNAESLFPIPRRLESSIRNRVCPVYRWRSGNKDNGMARYR